MSECFKLFDVIHKVTTNHDSIARITREVIEDFAADNVIYLELRTTPKVKLLPMAALNHKLYHVWFEPP